MPSKRTAPLGRTPARKPARPSAAKPVRVSARRPGEWSQRVGQVGWVLLPLRAFLGFVFLYAGLSKVADRRFLEASSPRSMHASVLAAKANSPIGSLLGPVADHSVGFGVLMAAAELAVALGLLLGLLTRVAAVGGMLLSLSLWLTVSWNASPWFTSADVVYLFALTPLVIAGSAGVLSVDAWLDRVRDAHPGRDEDLTRRTLLAGGTAVGGAVLLGGATLFRRSSPTSTARNAQAAASPHVLTPVAKVPVGGAVQVTNDATGDPAWVLQLQSGKFTAYDAICPHQGCTVEFVSAQTGFQCPCHGSQFDPQGKRINGPAPRGLTEISVTVAGGNVRAT